MSVRPMFVLAAIALSVATTPVLAEDGKMSNRLNSQSMERHVETSSREVAVVSGSNVLKGTYASGNADMPLNTETTMPDQSHRTINVWGARFDVPVR